MFSPTLIFVVAYAALGGFLFGYDLGLIGGALLKIQRYFHVRKSITLELIVGAAKLGAAAGTFLGGAAMARYGRRRALGLNAAAFTAGPLIMAAAAAPWHLMLGRLVVGLGIGMSATVTPAYIAELAPASIRGALVQMYEVMLCIGMLSAPLVDWAVSSNGGAGSWRLMVGLPAVAGLALAAAPVVLPESPRWLVTRNRLDEALEVLQVVLTGKAASPSPSSASLGGSGGMLSLRGLLTALTSGWSTGTEGGYQRVPGKDCCEAIVEGAWARTAPELARARWTALSLNKPQLLADSTHPESLHAIGTKQSLRKKVEQLLRRRGAGSSSGAAGFGGGGAAAAAAAASPLPVLADCVHGQSPDDPDSWYVVLAVSYGPPGSEGVAVLTERYVRQGGRWWFMEEPQQVPMLEQFVEFWDKYVYELEGEEEEEEEGRAEEEAGEVGEKKRRQRRRRRQSSWLGSEPFQGRFEYGWLTVPPRAGALQLLPPLPATVVAAGSGGGTVWLVDEWPESAAAGSSSGSGGSSGATQQAAGGWVYLDTAVDPATGLTAAQAAVEGAALLDAAAALRDPALDWDSYYFRHGRFDAPAGGSPSISVPDGRGGSSSSSGGGGGGGGSSRRGGGPGPRPAALSAQQQALHDAEDELIALWSSVESDRLAVLERRRQVWLERRQKQGGRRGRLGINWLTALKPPALDSIPEEAHSPTCGTARASSGVYSGGGEGGGWGAVALLVPAQREQQHREGAGKLGGGGSCIGAGAGAGLDGRGPGLDGRGPGYGSIREAGEEEEEAELGWGRAGQADCSSGSSGNSSGSTRGGGGGPANSVAKGGGVANVASALVKSLVSGGGGGGGGGACGAGAYASLPGQEPELEPDPGELSRLLGSPASSSAPGPGRPGRLGGGGGGAALAAGEEGFAGDGAAGGCGPGGPGRCPDMPGEGEEEEAAGLPSERSSGGSGSLAAVLCAMAGDVVALAGGPEARALGLALGLAVLNQANASTAIINYAPSLLLRLGGGSSSGSTINSSSVDGSSDSSSGSSSSFDSYDGSSSSGYDGGGDEEGDGGAMLYTGLVGVAKLAGVCAAMLLVDRCGRRPLLIGGALACGAALVGMTAAAAGAGGGDPQSRRLLLELCMCGFAFCFSISWAGLFWVVVSELFSMAAKSAAMSAATALLFLTGAVTDLVFLSLEDALGAHVFLLFAGVCVGGAAFVAAALPETKGRTLAEVQALMAVKRKSGSSSGRNRSSGSGSAGREAEDGGGDGREGRRWVEMRARGGGP
ncbi:hypothetical protein HYH02_001268 [Chlamydomonas schloesseri]|uniref:Major facilitator superfamily (MFS) profile domain-containing protein n=1 Tax=Chlamydomonas schloesseri TaxID=2026947 RepID=A0A835WVL3_9CHLO|nr:hypothetical protein HYH02_001268 [Chlamydomonas schloesseri]|eukprot:KAG2454234.1 hypothetical protein HYH02_001268 [Chlamydomonas schloesseri]